MINGQKVLGLVTARGGSKGLPGKNIRPLSGKPLIAWTIDAAKAARSLDAVVVSTDDAAIADAARRAGAEVPFMRPPELAGDTATSVDVVLHAIDWLASAGRRFDVVVLLEPTSPLREPADIERGLALLGESGAGSVVSVCRTGSAHPAFLARRGEDLRLRPYMESLPAAPRRQDVEALYFPEGTFYASRIDVLRAKRTFYHDDTAGYEVPKWKSLEIDDADDFLMAEALVAHKGLGK